MTYFEKLKPAERAAVEDYARREWERTASLEPPTYISRNAKADPEEWRRSFCELLASDTKRVQAILVFSQRNN